MQLSKVSITSITTTCSSPRVHVTNTTQKDAKHPPPNPHARHPRPPLPPTHLPNATLRPHRPTILRRDLRLDMLLAIGHRRGAEQGL